MAKYNLLVLSMVLLACSTIPARIISGQSIDVDAMIKNDGTEGANGAGVILRSYNGCSYNKKPHDLNSIFCCDKDHECWGSLQECMPNCPCKANCAQKKDHRSSETNMTPLVHG